ncbi:chemotaxis protein CheA [Rhodovulum viride]|uniref:Chemotaxis protein CheA n=1 Tax=Rhodovulum viride TaxID=1231134 RepID=A0ABX9DI84_9RHOB|nr:chemotaxis protein CheA [Rhodovulum viride]
MDDDDGAAVFLIEARELQGAIERNLLDLSAAPGDRALIDALFRDIHTLKGSGAMFGHVDLAHFLHGFETAFEALRAPGRTASDALINVALRACDQITALLDDAAAARAGNASILEALDVALGGAAPAADPPADTSPAMPAAAPAEEGWRISFSLGPTALGLGVNVPALLAELTDLAPDAVRITCEAAALPALDALDPACPPFAWTVEIAAALDRARIDEVFLFLRDDLVLDVTPLSGPDAGSAPDRVPETPPQTVSAAPPGASADAPAEPVPGTATRQRERSTMRVATERLDEIMDRVGELVIAESRLHDLSMALQSPALMAVAEDIRRLTSGMRETTMSIRMLPIGNLFSRFRRLVHDLSDQLAKPIDFVTTGGETELDKTVIELLNDPLVHILRNAADHGIEDGTARTAVGKPRQGTITLSATHAGAEVHIRIRDDGRGLDAGKLRAKAIERGLLPANSQATGPELFRLIFEPGFSTAPAVTELSGRGVGMDVVRSVVQGLRGQIDVDSEPGHGTTVTLRLPLTLAITDGLLVEVGGERYSIPVAAVEECVELPPDLALGAGRSNFLNVRGDLVPFLRLAEVFETPGPRPDFQKVVIVAGSHGRIGLVVDRIVANAQTVIKQLSCIHAGLKAFSGATILGDGTVALILDVGHLIALGTAIEDRARKRKGAA